MRAPRATTTRTARASTASTASTTRAANATSATANSAKDDAHLAALQAALAGEHAAVWACGRAAGELTGRQRSAALVELDAHRLSRDSLRRHIAELGVQPVDAAAAYVEPFEVTGRAGARRLLAHVGSALCATYADLAASSGPPARREAIGAASASAVRALSWGAQPQAFPGSQ